MSIMRKQFWKIALATVALAIALLIYAGRAGTGADAWWWSAAGAVANVVAGLMGDKPAEDADKPKPASLAEAIQGEQPPAADEGADEKPKPDSLVEAIRARREAGSDR
ncbi:MAG: hypothetical protein KC466_18680 [Myxococcales bacterium]|nr:hypothetical protein [Myxococcales bacterium]